MAQIQSHFAQVAGPPGPIFDWSLWKKAATAQVYQTVIGGVGWTIACNEFGVLILNQLTALGTDQIIINAAIVYANGLGGGSVFVDEGTYNLGANVALLTSVYLYGSGVATILTILAATDVCIDVNAVINVRIAHLSVATTGVGANDALQVRGASIAIEIENVYCLASGQDALSIAAASSEVYVHGCFLVGEITRYGINNAGDNVRITENRIDDTGDDGIWLQAGGTYCIVTGNRISDWTGEAIDWDEQTCQVAHNITAV